jgi:hypothetical protein
MQQNVASAITFSSSARDVKILKAATFQLASPLAPSLGKAQSCRLSAAELNASFASDLHVAFRKHELWKIRALLRCLLGAQTLKPQPDRSKLL